jgi:hypothetical protein
MSEEDFGVICSKINMFKCNERSYNMRVIRFREGCSKCGSEVNYELIEGNHLTCWPCGCYKEEIL